MIHFAYPNAKAEQFIGCGRFVVFMAGEQPSEGYEIADPECPSGADVIDAASILVPEPVHPHHIIYEKKDAPEQHYIGNSLGLAYLLALISRIRTLRSHLTRTDIWCTGCIELSGERPIIKSVISSGFEAKLKAFLSPETPEKLFIVPEANVDQTIHLQLDQRNDVQVFPLDLFPRHEFLEGKTILKIRRHELQALVDVIFEPFLLSQADTRPESQISGGSSLTERHIEEEPLSQQFAQTSGSIAREEAIEKLRKYGIHNSQIYLIDFIPLVEMLWADGQAQAEEIATLSEYIIRHVEHLNHEAGHEILTVESAQAFVNQFLQERPSPELLRTLRSLIAPIRFSESDGAANRVLRDSLLAACMDIASSSVTEHPYKYHERFNLEEKRCFFEILDSLER